MTKQYVLFMYLSFFFFTENDMYWEIIRLRKQMMLAKLGLSLTS